jgi:hypothetical protein
VNVIISKIGIVLVVAVRVILALIVLTGNGKTTRGKSPVSILKIDEAGGKSKL